MPRFLNRPRGNPPLSAAGDGSVSAAPVRSGIAAAAIVIMLGNVLSRVLGLVREQLAAGLFGTGDPIAAFTIADNVHTLLFDLLISGTLQAALIPVLAASVASDLASRAELRRIAGALLALFAIVGGVVVVLALVFAPVVVDAMTALGGDAGGRDPETTELTVTLVRLILPAVFCLGVSTILMGVLYALGRVTAPALGIAVRNAAVVVAMLLFADALGVKSMAVGVVVGALAIVAMQLVPLYRADALPRPNLDFGHPAVRQVLRLYLPIFLGLLVNTVAVVIDRNLAWGAERDALGAMRYATTLVQMVLGLVAAAISLAALPTLSRHFAAGDEAAFMGTLGRALAMVTVLIVPVVLGLAAVAQPAVSLIFQHGETDAAGARLIVIALLGYLPGTLCAAYDQVLIFAFYARQNTRAPVVVGVLAVLVYFVVAFSLVDWLGMLGLVIANSAQFAAHVAVMFWLARRSFGWTASARLRRTAGSCLVGGTGCALAALALWLTLRAGLPEADGWQEIGRELLLLGLPIVAGGAVYIAVLHRQGVEELATLRRAILGRFLPRLAE
ncbi:MAG: murein biosynthesis integral membrane protein MurJ [Thermomicrobiales bacterium]